MAWIPQNRQREVGTGPNLQEPGGGQSCLPLSLRKRGSMQGSHGAQGEWRTFISHSHSCTFSINNVELIIYSHLSQAISRHREGDLVPDGSCPTRPWSLGRTVNGPQDSITPIAQARCTAGHKKTAPARASRSSREVAFLSGPPQPAPHTPHPSGTAPGLCCTKADRTEARLLHHEVMRPRTIGTQPEQHCPRTLDSTHTGPQIVSSPVRGAAGWPSRGPERVGEATTTA